MKNTFNIARFAKFFTTELRLFRNVFLIFMGIIVVDLITSIISGHTSGRSAGGLIIFLIAITPFALYNFLYHPTKSFTYAMLPASWLEKFMSAWIMCVVFVPLLLVGFSTGVAILLDLLFSQIITSYRALFDFQLFFAEFYLETIAAQAVAFCGAFWFKRQKIGRTILTIVIIVFALVFVGFTFMRLGVGDAEGVIRIEGYQFPTYLMYGFAVLLWVISLIKFRRTQI